MAKPIVLVGATLVAAALGAVASVVSVSLRGPTAPAPPAASSGESEPPPRTRRPERRRRNAAARVELPRVFSTDAEEFALPEGTSLSDLLSSPDEQVRLDTARSILRQGSAALAQVRALRPSTPEGEELARRLALALQRLQRNERHVDWVRRPANVRMEVRLAAFSTVLPEEMLLVERREFWTAYCAVVRSRLAAGRATEGELALAELEDARVKRELGELDAAVYAALLDERFASASDWVDEIETEGATPPARISRYREQLARLRD